MIKTRDLRSEIRNNAIQFFPNWKEFVLVFFIVSIVFSIVTWLKIFGSFNVFLQYTQISGILDSIITIQATVITIVVMLTFLIIQIVGSSFSRRVTHYFWDNSHATWLLSLFLISIIGSIVLRWSIPEEPKDMGLLHVFCCLFWIILSFEILLALIPYSNYMKCQLDPLTLTTLLFREIHTDLNKPESDEAFQAICDIFITGAERNDVRFIEDISKEFSFFWVRFPSEEGKKRLFNAYRELVMDSVRVALMRDHGRMILTLTKSLIPFRTNENQQIRIMTLETTAMIEENIWNTSFHNVLVECLNMYAIVDSDVRETEDMVIKNLYHKSRFSGTHKKQRFWIKEILVLSQKNIHHYFRRTDSTDIITRSVIPYLEHGIITGINEGYFTDNSDMDNFFSGFSTTLFNQRCNQKFEELLLSKLIAFIEAIGKELILKNGTLPLQCNRFLIKLAAQSAKQKFMDGITDSLNVFRRFYAQQDDLYSQKGEVLPQDIIAGYDKIVAELKKEVNKYHIT